ncbi:MAG: hypothetical protein OEM15_13280, partial [Myxococcales bacterium]|nr:hypothetical protein [Myxococcales bacterium]
MKKKTLTWIAVAAVVGLVVLGLAGASPFSMFMLSDDMHNTTNAMPPSGNAGDTAGDTAGSNEGHGNETSGNSPGGGTPGTDGDGNAGHGDDETGYDPDNPGKSTGTNRGGNAEGGEEIDNGD